jgi:GDPmannose 4,6-dehydratase
VTQRIVSSSREAEAGKRGKVHLGKTAIGPDWLWGDDVARALAMIGPAPESRGYTVASGRASTVDDFAGLACRQFDLKPDGVISHESCLMHPLEIETTLMDPSKIRGDFDWEPEVSFETLLSRLVQEEL